MKTICTILFLVSLVMLPSRDVEAQKKKDPPTKKTDQPTTKPPAGYPQPDAPYKNKNHSPEMVFVEGGTFQMGSDEGESDEKPVHNVTLNSFLISKYEVTQELWESVMGNRPSYFKGSKRPVEFVNWCEAVEFCNKLSEKEGLQKAYSGSRDNITCDFDVNGYRLPTEAEWEYAARGGKKSKGYTYSGSNNLNEVGWYGASNNSGNRSKEEGTSGVGKKQPNELGIYDISGNVWEWCWDRYGDYSSGSQTNPGGPSAGSARVCRGGCWYYNVEYCRIVDRNCYTPDSSHEGLGFRLARTR